MLSGWVRTVDPTKCSGCGKCVSLCHRQAPSGKRLWNITTIKFHSNLRLRSFYGKMIRNSIKKGRKMNGVSKKTGQRHPLSSGIWHGAVWRKVELPNHLRAGNFGDTALQRAAEGNGKYYGCSAGFHAEGVDCQRDRSEEVLR